MNFSNLAKKIAEEANKPSNCGLTPYGIIEVAALKVLNSLELPGIGSSTNIDKFINGWNACHDKWTRALEYEEDKLLTERKRLMKRWKEKNDIGEESFDDEPQTKGQDMTEFHELTEKLFRDFLTDYDIYTPTKEKVDKKIRSYLSDKANYLCSINTKLTTREILGLSPREPEKVECPDKLGHQPEYSYQEHRQCPTCKAYSSFTWTATHRATTEKDEK